MVVEKMLRLGDLVERLSLSKSTILRMVDRGEFPAPRQVSPRAVRWTEADIIAWQEAKKPMERQAQV